MLDLSLPSSPAEVGPGPGAEGEEVDTALIRMLSPLTYTEEGVYASHVDDTYKEEEL